MIEQRFLNPDKIINQASISKHSIVADFGSGSGKYAEILSKVVGDNGKVYLIEIQKEVLGRVKNDFNESGVKNVEYVNSNLEKERGSKIGDERVDFVLISSLFFQLVDKDAVINEAVRILRKNGKILVIEWKDSFAGIGPVQELIVKEKEIMDLVSKHPLKLERELDAGDYHYAFLFRKV